MRSGLAPTFCALIMISGCGGDDKPVGSDNGLGGPGGGGGSSPTTNTAPANSPPSPTTNTTPATNPPPPTNTTQATSPPTTVAPAVPGTVVGPTTVGCPGTEPAADSACDTPGRLCKWTRSCGAGGVTGWCTPAKTWRVVVPTCQPGCPTWPPGETHGSQFGPPPDAKCTAGLECRYPSTPMGSGTNHHCVAQPDGRTIWPLPNAWNDGWVAAPATAGTGNNCGELTKCSGISGCGDTCPNAAPRACYCGPDGLQYCEVGDACGGGGGTTTGTTMPGRR